MLRAILISCNGEVKEERIKAGIREKRRLVGGDVECITLDTNFSIYMYINEAGKLLHLNRNDKATLLFQSYRGVDWIAGDAIVVGCNTRTGDPCSLTDDQIKDILDRIDKGGL